MEEADGQDKEYAYLASKKGKQGGKRIFRADRE